MNEPLIHIGYHKTATTWLQNELFILKSEFFIPVSNRKKGHSTLARDFICDDEGYLLNSFTMNEKVILQNLNKILLNNDFSNDKIPVISHERLSGNPHSSGFDSSIIAKRIHKSFPSAKILIVIREQSSWILSNYFQYLTIGGNHNLKKYLNTKYDGKRPGFTPSHLEFHHLIKDYQSKFTNENVLVIPYELINRDIDLFLKTLGVFLKKEIYDSTQVNFKKRYNVKRNHFLNYKLRGLNPFIRSSSVNNYFTPNSKIRRRLVKMTRKTLSQFVPQKCNDNIQIMLQKEIEQWVGNRFNESNCITQNLINVNLEKFGYKTTTTSSCSKNRTME